MVAEANALPNTYFDIIERCFHQLAAIGGHHIKLV